MSSAKVINGRGGRLVENAVYIGRPSIWGNPFKIGRDGSRREVIAKYRGLVLRSPRLLARLPELHGKDLACWCAPQPCHGDVLIDLAARGPKLWRRVIIAGGRGYAMNREDWRLLDLMRDKLPIGEVVSGDASGADTEGRLWAEARGLPVHRFPADWNRFGNRAGPIRNREMALFADTLIAFRGGTGTADMVRQATRLGLLVLDWRAGAFDPFAEMFD